ncbi:peptidoglycan DD-metalloendopeptidase family protein [Neobacillus sp. 179-C4.2 HS]|jgi:murein DD-endopeptidase MepM/ murein hydrolase activator NlpD|uniref:Peptidoglycan DD-metalloendopeptidase family protein n=1 Tax=Neobacillus driksii TaxID=3035913 RepID=A0ABV4YMK5_9BACI|nr:peptidoglycan DD-metalloendopeptidase family protein [Neobacillus sp. 179.-C4.2 HS]MDP5193400.1 peptidoglycan DD-metalloendopeptidase family protein [Neobacillus sp. 179.-C4.2 HS]
MRDYIRRLLIAAIMALCVSLLFLGGKQTEASMQDSQEIKAGWIWPTDGVVSDTYGTRHGTHKGIDIAGSLNSPIVAVEDGVVGKSYYSKTYGNVVFINHPNNFVTVYAHLNNRLVSEGQEIKQGDRVGTMGRTGESTGVHLHFESHQIEWTYDKKNAIDPERLLGNAEVGVAVKGGMEGTSESLTASTNVKGHSAHYIVQAGDTLSSIALKSNLSVAKLKEVNQLKSDLILPEQVLVIQN